MDLDSELEMYFPGVGRVHFDFTGSSLISGRSARRLAVTSFNKLFTRKKESFPWIKSY